MGFLSDLNRGTGDADERAATLAKIQAVNPMQQSKGILETAGTKLKDMAINYALNTFTGGLYNRFKTPYRVLQAADDRFLNDKIPGITKFAKYNKNPISGYKKNTFESDGDDRPIPKNVIAANVQKFSPAQINSLQSNIALLESVLDSGQYRGTKLNGSQLSKVSNQRNSLLEQYNMIQEYLV